MCITQCQAKFDCMCVGILWQQPSTCEVPTCTVIKIWFLVGDSGQWQLGVTCHCMDECKSMSTLVLTQIAHFFPCQSKICGDINSGSKDQFKLVVHVTSHIVMRACICKLNPQCEVECVCVVLDHLAAGIPVQLAYWYPHRPMSANTCLLIVEIPLNQDAPLFEAFKDPGFEVFLLFPFFPLAILICALQSQLTQIYLMTILWSVNVALISGGWTRQKCQ